MAIVRRTEARRPGVKQCKRLALGILGGREINLSELVARLGRVFPPNVIQQALSELIAENEIETEERGG